MEGQDSQGTAQAGAEGLNMTLEGEALSQQQVEIHRTRKNRDEGFKRGEL